MIFGQNAKITKKSINFLNDKPLKGQPQDVEKLKDKIDTLKKTLPQIVAGTKNLHKFLKYSKCPTEKSGHG